MWKAVAFERFEYYSDLFLRFHFACRNHLLFLINRCRTVSQTRPTASGWLGTQISRDLTLRRDFVDWFLFCFETDFPGG